MKMQKQILVYVSDYDDNSKPIFAVANDISEIPLDCDGSVVGIYVLTKQTKFQVTAELK